MKDIIYKKNIIILGAGFGGLKCALELEKNLKKLGLFKQYNIILIDKNNYQLYTPALYEIAATFIRDADALGLKKICTIPIEEAIKNKKIKFIQSEIQKINPENKNVILKDYAELKFEYLVLALGSQPNYFNIPGLQKYSVALKNFNNAIKIRNRLFELTNKKPDINIIIAGAGATGVELSAELMAYLNRLKENFAGKNYKIILIEANEKILPNFSKEISDTAFKRLRKLGIEILCGQPIESIDSEKISLKNGKSFNYDILIWTGGVKPNSIINKLNFIKEKNGKIKVNETLACVPASASPLLKEKIFAIGDIASVYIPKTKNPLPGMAQFSVKQSFIAAKNIIADILRKPKISYKPPKRLSYVISLGKKFAIAKIKFLKIVGFPAWIIRIGIQLYYLLLIMPIRKALSIWWHAIKIYIKND